MNSRMWLRRFEANRTGRSEPQWHLPSPDDPATTALLVRSLSHFELGERGDGEVLLSGARQAFADDDNYRAALSLFIAEEQEHARLLACLVRRLGGTVIASHWTHTAFRMLRRSLGVHFELQVLLVAEVVGTAYYRLLRRHANDLVITQVCDLILTDEELHLEFHRDRLDGRRSNRSPVAQILWNRQFRTLLTLAGAAAWLDHGGTLRALGASRKEFWAAIQMDGSHFLAPGALDGLT